MDLIGPLERSARGYRIALVLVDYAMRYPEAVPLRSISAKSVAEALFRLISRVGIPKEIRSGLKAAAMGNRAFVGPRTSWTIVTGRSS